MEIMLDFLAFVVVVIYCAILESVCGSRGHPRYRDRIAVCAASRHRRIGPGSRKAGLPPSRRSRTGFLTFDQAGVAVGEEAVA
jgi:hypothetical protein